MLVKIVWFIWFAFVQAVRFTLATVIYIVLLACIGTIWDGFVKMRNKIKRQKRSGRFKWGE